MINRQLDFSQTGKLWILLATSAIIVYGLVQLSNSIAAGSTRFALLVGAGFVAFFVAGRIASNWRSGVSFFFVWLTFEDLVRKYTGNSMYIYFIKDVLIGVVYVSLLASGTRRNKLFFRPPFLYSLGLFVILGIVQVFNPISPSIFYGLLGVKLYFYYVPLIFAGYALLRNREDLRRFVVLTMAVAGVVAIIGILQTIIGMNFLNPRNAGTAIDELGHLIRVTSEGVMVARPPSVFVSDGRFAAYTIVVFILGLGSAGFLLLSGGRGRAIVFPAVGLLAVAAAMTGSRGAFVYACASGVVLSIGMVWGAPKRFGEGYRLIKALRRSFLYVAIGVAVAVAVFPSVFGAHITYYEETLNPASATFEGGYRTWSYPAEQLLDALSDPDWVIGHGIGTASLGAQYVTEFFSVPPGTVGVENGYGELIVELGILGPILWLLWTTHLFIAACRVLLKVRGTWAFPMALSIAWLDFVILYTMTWGGLVQYENFITNAYLWITTGFMFRLEELVQERAANEELQIEDDLVSVKAVG